MSIIDRFWETVPAAWFQTRAHIRRSAAERFALTVEQFQVLRRIRRGMTSASAIADDMRVSRPAVSKTVDGLVNRSLVTRTTDSQDRRHIQLALTDEGTHIIDGIYAETTAWLEERFAALDESQRAELLRGLDILAELINQK